MKLKAFQELFLSSVDKAAINSDLRDSIIPIGKLSQQKVIEIYKSDYLARLTEALGETYETVWFVVGDEEFFELCKTYIKNNPSPFRDLGQYGDGFPEFIKSNKLSQDFPFLIELANFERAFWKLFHKASLPFDKAVWNLVNENNLNQLLFSPSGEVVFFKSDWKIFSLFKARNEDSSIYCSDDWNSPEQFVLYKKADHVKSLMLTNVQFHFLKELLAHKTISQALELVEYISQEELGDLFFKLRNEEFPLQIKEANNE